MGEVGGWTQKAGRGRDLGETQPGGHSPALLPSLRPCLLLLSPSKLSPHQLHQRIQGVPNPSGAVLEVKSQPHLLGVPLFSKGFFGKWAGRSLLSQGDKSSPSLCHLDARDKLTTGKHCGLPRDHILTRPAPRLRKEAFKDRCHAS